MRALRTLSIATVATIVAAFALGFFYAPLDADQGFIQKIFYLHVPLGIAALVGFMVAAVHAIRHLRSGDSVHDARSYVSIHIFVGIPPSAVANTRGCRRLSASRTARKLSGTKAPAVIANTDAFRACRSRSSIA